MIALLTLMRPTDETPSFMHAIMPLSQIFHSLIHLLFSNFWIRWRVPGDDLIRPCEQAILVPLITTIRLPLQSADVTMAVSTIHDLSCWKGSKGTRIAPRRNICQHVSKGEIFNANDG